jgi:hypothetical protein
MTTDKNVLLVEVKNLQSETKNCTGICYDCLLLENCTMPGIENRQFCEEYVPHYKNVTQSSITPEEKPLVLPVLGLCMDCENKADCRYAMNEGGVWNCEEYR